MYSNAYPFQSTINNREVVYIHIDDYVVLYHITGSALIAIRPYNYSVHVDVHISMCLLPYALPSIVINIGKFIINDN